MEISTVRTVRADIKPMSFFPVSLGLRHNLLLSKWTDAQAFGKQASFSMYYEVLEPASGVHESISAETNGLLMAAMPY